MTIDMQNILYISQGIGLTLQLLLGSITIGFILGMMLSILRYNGVLVKTIYCYISLVRGTPLLLQLSFIYFAIPHLIGLKLGLLGAGIVSFGLNSSAYIAEILRAGIESIPVGQFEAAQSLQIPKYYTWKDIILPQVLRNILPAMISEVISLLKETALIATMGGLDIMRRAQMVAAEEFTYFLPLCSAAIFYYGMVLLIEYLGRILGRILAKRGQYGQAS